MSAPDNHTTQKQQAERPFAEITIRLWTTKPHDSDAEVFALGDEVEAFQDNIETSCRSFLRPGWLWEIVEG